MFAEQSNVATSAGIVGLLAAPPAQSAGTARVGRYEAVTARRARGVSMRAPVTAARKRSWSRGATVYCCSRQNL